MVLYVYGGIILPYLAGSSILLSISHRLLHHVLNVEGGGMVRCSTPLETYGMVLYRNSIFYTISAELNYH